MVEVTVRNGVDRGSRSLVSVESEPGLGPVTRLYVHDFDGPLRDPRTGLTNYKLPFQMVHAVNRGRTAWIINTGRDSAHIEQYLSYPLLAQFSTHPDLMNRTVAICEKGAVSVVPTSEWGIFKTTINEDLAVPRELREAIVHDILNKDPRFKEIVRAEPKLAMVTFSARPYRELDEFRALQGDLSVAVKEIINRSDYKSLVTTDSTSNSIDIQRLGTGKGVGFKRGIEELRENGVEFSPDCEVIGFGDSGSDPEMIKAAQEEGFRRAYYVHVGEKEIGDQPFPVIRPFGINTEATWNVQAPIEGAEIDLLLSRAREHARRGEMDQVMNLVGMGIAYGIDPRAQQETIAVAYENQAALYVRTGQIHLAEDAREKAESIREKLKKGAIRGLWESY